MLISLDKRRLFDIEWLPYAPFFDSYKGRIGRIKSIGIAMETLGRVRHAAARAARLAYAKGPPVGGTFQFQIFIQTPSPEIWSETISGSEEGPGGEVG